MPNPRVPETAQLVADAELRNGMPQRGEEAI